MDHYVQYIIDQVTPWFQSSMEAQIKEIKKIVTETTMRKEDIYADFVNKIKRDVIVLKIQHLNFKEDARLICKAYDKTLAETSLTPSVLKELKERVEDLESRFDENTLPQPTPQLEHVMSKMKEMEERIGKLEKENHTLREEVNGLRFLNKRRKAEIVSLKTEVREISNHNQVSNEIQEKVEQIRMQLEETQLNKQTKQTVEGTVSLYWEQGLFYLNKAAIIGDRLLYNVVYAQLHKRGDKYLYPQLIRSDLLSRQPQTIDQLSVKISSWPRMNNIRKVIISIGGEEMKNMALSISELKRKLCTSLRDLIEVLHHKTAEARIYIIPPVPTPDFSLEDDACYGRYAVTIQVFAEISKECNNVIILNDVAEELLEREGRQPQTDSKKRPSVYPGNFYQSGNGYDLTSKVVFKFTDCLLARIEDM